ncbi:hypothetical protein FACS1894217_12210 [Clostridia bacterium]|nr:hypothetical protein FACS1894217_12210 [Clostridia bacterium]
MNDLYLPEYGRAQTRGTFTVELRDALTDKVVERVEKKNTITRAIDSIRRMVSNYGLGVSSSSITSPGYSGSNYQYRGQNSNNPIIGGSARPMAATNSYESPTYYGDNVAMWDSLALCDVDPNITYDDKCMRLCSPGQGSRLRGFCVGDVATADARQGMFNPNLSYRGKGLFGGYFHRVADFTTDKANGTFRVVANGRPIREGQGPNIDKGLVARFASGPSRYFTDSDGQIWCTSEGYYPFFISVDTPLLVPYGQSAKGFPSATGHFPTGYSVAAIDSGRVLVSGKEGNNCVIVAKRASDNVWGLLLFDVSNANVVAFIANSQMGGYAVNYNTSAYFRGVTMYNGNVYAFGTCGTSGQCHLYKVPFASGTAAQVKTITNMSYSESYAYNPKAGTFCMPLHQRWCSWEQTWNNGTLTFVDSFAWEHPYTNGIALENGDVYLGTFGNNIVFSSFEYLCVMPKYHGLISSVALLDAPITKTTQNTMQVTYHAEFDWSAN